MHTAGLFSYENLRKSAKARVLKYSRRKISGREVYLGPRSQYYHPGLVHFNPSLSEDLAAFPAWRFLENLESAAFSTWHFAERCTMIVLTSIALFGLVIYLLKVIFALRLLTKGVAFSLVFSLMNSFAPFIRMLREYRNDLLNANRPPPPVQRELPNSALSARTFSAPNYSQLNL